MENINIVVEESPSLNIVLTKDILNQGIVIHTDDGIQTNIAVSTEPKNISISAPSKIDVSVSTDKTTVEELNLNNVDNTSDLNKPISNATQTALNLKEDKIVTGTALQYFAGDKSWKNFPSYPSKLTDLTNDAGFITIASIPTDKTKLSDFTNDTNFITIASITKAAVGLPNVDNTSDANKPISSATATAIANLNTVYEPIISTKKSAFNVDFGTTHLTVAYGDHIHAYEPVNSNIQTHISSVSNPHNTTAAQVGLGNVPNLSFSGSNTGDETTASIKTKLGITTLSGSNTGDQDLSSFIPGAGIVVSGMIPYFSSTTGKAILASGLFWDSVNLRLGINITNPAVSLDVGSAQVGTLYNTWITNGAGARIGYAGTKIYMYDNSATPVIKTIFDPSVADSASAVAYLFGTKGTLVAVGATHTEWWNGAGRIASISATGRFQCNGGANFGNADISVTTLNIYGSIGIINKASSTWIPFATRNVTGAEAVYDLTNIGTISSKYNRPLNCNLYTTNTTLTVLNDFVSCNASSGVITINLFTPASEGYFLYIKKIDSSSNKVIIHNNSSGLIDGLATYELALPYEFVQLVWSNAVWNVIGE